MLRFCADEHWAAGLIVKLSNWWLLIAIITTARVSACLVVPVRGERFFQGLSAVLHSLLLDTLVSPVADSLFRITFKHVSEFLLESLTVLSVLLLLQKLKVCMTEANHS